MDIIPDLRVVAVQAAGLLLILVIFKLFLFKPIMDTLDSRRREIESRYEAAEADKQVAEELRGQYEQRLASIDEELRAKITSAIKEGQQMREEIIADARAKAEVMVNKAQEEIRHEKHKALVELKTTLADLVVNAASKLIHEELDQAKHHKLVSRFIDELDEVVK